MKLNRKALRRLILKEFKDQFNDFDIGTGEPPLPPMGDRGKGGGGKPPAVLRIYLGDPGRLIAKIPAGSTTLTLYQAIDRAVLKFQSILARLEAERGVIGMQPDDFPDTMGPERYEDKQKQQTIVYFNNLNHMDAYPPEGSSLYRGGKPMYPDNPEYYRASTAHGPGTELLLNVEDRDEWGPIAMDYILKKYPDMRIDYYS